MLSLALKRLFDIAASCIGLLLLAPVLLGIAVWIKRDSPGPVFFRQQRIGRHGEPFRIYKFRSMRQDNAGLQITVGADDRITRSGHFIRAYKLDELPQLINVLLGDMSVVGPRPLLVEYLPLYNAKQARRHEVRPGVTGLAQVSGRNALSWEDKFELDVRYVDELSPALDARILLDTVRAVFVREGISAEGQATMTRFEGSQ